MTWRQILKGGMEVLIQRQPLVGLCFLHLFYLAPLVFMSPACYTSGKMRANGGFWRHPWCRCTFPWKPLILFPDPLSFSPPAWMFKPRGLV